MTRASILSADAHAILRHRALIPPKTGPITPPGARPKRAVRTSGQPRRASGNTDRRRPAQKQGAPVSLVDVSGSPGRHRSGSPTAATNQSHRRNPPLGGRCPRGTRPPAPPLDETQVLSAETRSIPRRYAGRWPVDTLTPEGEHVAEVGSGSSGSLRTSASGSRPSNADGGRASKGRRRWRSRRGARPSRPPRSWSRSASARRAEVP